MSTGGSSAGPEGASYGDLVLTTMRNGKRLPRLRPVVLHRRTRAHEIAIPVGIIDAPDGRPEFRFAEP